MNIICLSGRLQSGKTTASNFLFGLEMLSLGLIDYFRMNNDGKLIVPALFEDGVREGVFDPMQVTDENYEYLATNIWPHIKQYNFADQLKQKVCIGILGLTYEQCYGSDDAKNTLTNLKWEDMPNVTTVETPQSPVDKKVAGRLGDYYQSMLNGMVYHKPGFMTAREVMQFVGTEVFRKMYNDVWVDATIRQIKIENTAMALIGDCRFPNEVRGVQKAGGKVIRLTKNSDKETKHESESSLDKNKFDWKNFDYVLDNANMDIDTQNNELYKVLSDMNILPFQIKFENGKYEQN